MNTTTRTCIVINLLLQTISRICRHIIAQQNTLKKFILHRCFNDFMKCLIKTYTYKNHFHIYSSNSEHSSFSHTIFTFHYLRLPNEFNHYSFLIFIRFVHTLLLKSALHTSRVYFGTHHTFQFIGSAQIANKKLYLKTSTKLK